MDADIITGATMDESVKIASQHNNTTAAVTNHGAAHDEGEIIDDLLIEEISIDGMCGVY